MKQLLITFSVFSLALASASYAATRESGSVSFTSAVRVGTSSLPAGVYAIQWQEGTGQVQLKISGNGHEISVAATAAAAAGPDEVLTHRDGAAQVVDGLVVKETALTIKNP